MGYGDNKTRLFTPIQHLLRDRMSFGAVTEANKELFRMPKRVGTLKVDSQSSDRA